MNASQARPSTLLWLYAVTIFLSAFLLFQVQPMIGKYILPWFGSTPGVWATALLFFQLMLLGGYAYAHFVVSRLSWKRQAIVHVILLSLALISLPITPAEALKPIDPDAPVARILLILMLSVGAPFFLLSTTAPLLQRWYALLHPDRSPYR
ncbi:MAG: ferrichrome ABC transporter permease, partial [Gammaproteobacteria bacterium]|nr:ferrichrome ABC transporter permease [Gammaproteobacteria bacterium]